ncbi:hypothetical protein DM480_03495 [Sphingomonas sp. FARSPH]|jgi:hypothetical protein|nr:hypothetical protein DM480_03495 [Sphingomonas sp. FARSPH]
MAGLFVTIALLAVAGSALTQELPKDPIVLPDADSSDDIVVRALRIPREKLPVQVEWARSTQFDSTIIQENSAMFARCAIKGSDRATLRNAVEGAPNYASTRYAIGWLMARQRGCYRPSPPAPVSDDPTANGTITDRGVLIEQVLADFAPDATLDTAQTYDPVISRRMMDTEQHRNRYRLANDYDAFRVSACLVQRQPRIATRFVHAPSGSDLSKGLAQALLIGGRDCLGQVKRITIDPTFLRFYVTEAFYRWVVAARGVDTLIPSG